MSTTMPGQRFLPAGLSRRTAGSWRVDPARSQASFAARVAGRPVGGRLPLAGQMLMAEPIEDSTVRLAARTSAISTGSPWLDRLLAGPGFLDAGAFPEISFRSELLLRRHFRSVAGWCQVWPDVPVRYSGNGWMRLGVGQCLSSLAPR